MSQYLVDINIAVYNQAPYLRQTLDSVLSQKAKFRYRLLIGDDCSTDGSVDILKEYELRFPNIKVIYQPKNIGLKDKDRNGFVLLRNSTAKYIILLDGDDYWIDDTLLQKQVEFLEQHPEYSLVGCRYIFVDNNGNPIPSPAYLVGCFEPEKASLEVNIDNFLSPYILKTLTVMFRNGYLDRRLFSYRTFSDLFIWADLLTKGKGACLNFYGGAYRIANTGTWSSLSSIKKNIENYKLAVDLSSAFENKYAGIENFRLSYEETLYNLLRKKYHYSKEELQVLVNILCSKIKRKLKAKFTAE